MRVFTILAAILLFAGLKSSAQDTQPFTYKVGSVMTYEDVRFDQDGSASKNTVTWKVAKVGDKNYIDASDTNNKHTFMFSYADGFFYWGNVDEQGIEELGLRAFKVGAKVGDTWSPSATLIEDVTLTFNGDEEITTPGGKFTAKKVTFDIHKSTRVTFWFADKVGLVKAMRQWTIDGNVFVTSAAIELQKFVEGK